MPANNAKRMTLEQAAAFLKLTPSELRSVAVQNLITFSQQGDRMYFSQDDLDEWLSRRIIDYGHLSPAAQRREKKTLHLPDTSRPFLAQLLSSDGCACGLSAKSRPSALKALTELAASTGCVYDPADLYIELLEREEVATTAIEMGAALPHPHHRFEVPLFDESFLCVATLRNPIFYGASSDGSKTDVFFLTCCLDSDLHIQTISRICQLCAETSLLEDLRNADSPEDMHRIIVDIDEHPQAHPLKKLPLPEED